MLISASSKLSAQISGPETGERTGFTKQCFYEFAEATYAQTVNNYDELCPAGRKGPGVSRVIAQICEGGGDAHTAVKMREVRTGTTTKQCLHYWGGQEYVQTMKVLAYDNSGRDQARPQPTWQGQLSAADRRFYAGFLVGFAVGALVASGSGGTGHTLFYGTLTGFALGGIAYLVGGR